ncbi:E3 ubiquitin-protein ligase CHFR-like [Rhopilema esculentum]|uniref:E3 ubiquitin-protein ligase CHFR-like n=1 Tax=Rhopilema esculentum TaxID=499914 RepID=UPI0031DFFB17
MQYKRNCAGAKHKSVEKMASGSCCWGNLVALKMLEDGSFEQGDAVQLMKNEVTIGRLQACDVAHTENKLLSGCHCRLIHNSDNGKKYLLDTSKNGTLVNNRKVKNGMTEISDGAIISCVHKKKEPANDVTYIFKDLSPPEINVQERNLDINCTQEYDCDADENVEESSVSEKKRKSNLNTEDGIQSKIPRIDSSCRAKSLEPTSEKIKENDREVEENLTCGICQDIFHECVSVQPCMHSFCAACYSGWMSQSKICPTCRKSVKQVGKNHILNNLVAAFLKKHPECQRAKEELDEMNKKDLIKGQTVKVQNAFGDDSHFNASQDYDLEEDEDEDYEDDDYEDNDDDDDDLTVAFHQPAIPYPHILARVPSLFSRPADARCRQCPNFNSQSNSSQGNNDVPAAGFTCSLNQVHILCSCCNQCFPDRRGTVLSAKKAGAASNASQPSEKINMDIQCTACGRLYCNLYWGCRKPGCLGCLNKFEDFNFGAACLSRILNNNEFESTVLKNYLAQKSIGVKDLLKICVEKLQSKEFVCPSRPDLTANDIVCFSCGLRYFKELTYQYRSHIPEGELPVEVMRRDKCYWGKNCRTQQHNNNHASRFNHICEQTRFV